jgi:formiminotetrahydrofolate cyclodeaminase
MNILKKIKRLFNKKVNSYTISQETDEKKRVRSEIILTDKESLEMDRKKRMERFEKWLKEHGSSV